MQSIVLFGKTEAQYRLLRFVLAIKYRYGYSSHAYMLREVSSKFGIGQRADSRIIEQLEIRPRCLLVGKSATCDELQEQIAFALEKMRQFGIARGYG